MTKSLHPDIEYQAFLQQGRFMIQRSASTGRCVFYPRAVEPGAGGEDLEWVEACGRGFVYSTTIVRMKPPGCPYNVAIIQLQEGPRLMSRVEGIDLQDVRIGLPVRARIVRDENLAFVVFDPA
jgi:uncharacterized OB-fold protein